MHARISSAWYNLSQPGWLCIQDMQSNCYQMTRYLSIRRIAVWRLEGWRGWGVGSVAAKARQSWGAGALMFISENLLFLCIPRVSGWEARIWPSQHCLAWKPRVGITPTTFLQSHRDLWARSPITSPRDFRLSGIAQPQTSQGLIKTQQTKIHVRRSQTWLWFLPFLGLLRAGRLGDLPPASGLTWNSEFKAGGGV